ncbi:hypothetical protein B9J07_12905 [Sinorhizobium sp. LM21]|uniref:XRE family transcriptional regulator n=1 Tax=Sinorhizobium phage phiLM21 TaxID=1524882 RepID=UPI0004E5CE69|nr:XRE family transcriptional regulator [Sinorhizobium phage phiLM21]AII27771.1 XRE family transcriptional regulator [Sinorhizobium phage phiLM21]OWZ93535.1 hypothetical protein B9J07_12905 [Sinorhizobium sp. LM21]
MFEKWVEAALKHGQLSQAELARQLHQRFGWADDRSVINKILKSRRDVSAKEMFEISQITGFPLPAKNGVVAERGNLQEIKKPVDMVQVRGKVAANTWMDVDEMDFTYEDMEVVPSLSGYPAAWQFGLRVDGNCLNKVASHGDILVCLDVIKAVEEINENDLVIVERRKYYGQMVQRTAKRVRRTAKGFELWPESTDPAHQEPILLYESTEGEDVSIIGKVLWILRKP